MTHTAANGPAPAAAGGSSVMPRASPTPIPHDAVGRVHDVWAIACTRDGRTMVTGGNRGQVLSWDASGRILRSFPGHTARVNAIGISPDGRLIASASEGATLQVSELATGRGVHRLPGIAMVRAVAFSPDGRVLAIGTRGTTIRRLDLVTGTMLPELGHPHGAVHALLWLRDGRLVCGGRERSPAVRDPTAGRVLLVLDGHTDRVEAMAVSPDESLLASANEDGTIRVWELATRRCRFVLARPGQRPASVAFHPDGLRVASAGKDGFVRLWDTRTGAAIWEAGLARRMHAVGLSPDGRHVAAAADDRGLHILDVLTGRETARRP